MFRCSALIGLAACASFYGPAASAQGSGPGQVDSYRSIARQEAEKAHLPFDIADAVMAIESGYDAAKVGGVGEIGLMQVRPGTAAMLGFTSSAADLAKPEINIHYGVTYLAEAWRLAGGDLCRALMKYRAGHGEEVMTPLSVTYCGRARAHLASVGSRFAQGFVPGLQALAVPLAPKSSIRRPATRLRGAAFWAAHEARIRAISARIERRWRVLATR